MYLNEAFLVRRESATVFGGASNRNLSVKPSQNKCTSFSTIGISSTSALHAPIGLPFTKSFLEEAEDNIAVNLIKGVLFMPTFKTVQLVEKLFECIRPERVDDMAKETVVSKELGELKVMKKRNFVVQDLLSKIYQNQFSNGKLPNQRTMAQLYRVSRYTIQEATKTLEEIGVIKTVQGSGMYVQERLHTNPLIFNTLTRTPYERISSKVISLKKRKSTPEENQIFQLDETEDIWIFKRVRIVDFKIEQIEQSKMPVSLFPDLSEEIIERSIQAYVQEKGYTISHFITSYSPVAVSKEQAELLMCKRNTAAMRIENRCLLEDGRVYEYSELTAIDYMCTYITPFDQKSHQARKAES